MEQMTITSPETIHFLQLKEECTTEYTEEGREIKHSLGLQRKDSDEQMANYSARYVVSDSCTYTARLVEILLKCIIGSLCLKLTQVKKLVLKI